MNKAELIDVVAQRAGISKKQATDAVETIFTAVTETLKSGGKVQLVGFGRFTVTHRIPRKTKIPGTDKVVDIPARKTVKFTAGKALKSALN